jgi:hypothetical protein
MARTIWNDQQLEQLHFSIPTWCEFFLVLSVSFCFGPIGNVGASALCDRCASMRMWRESTWGSTLDVGDSPFQDETIGLGGAPVGMHCLSRAPQRPVRSTRNDALGFVRKT